MTVKMMKAGCLLAALALPLAVQADKLTLRHVGPGYLTGISANGQAATGVLMPDYQAFRWTAKTGAVPLGRGTYAALGVQAGSPAISGDGTTISSTMLSDDGTRATAGRWTVAAGWQQLSPPLPADGGVMDNQDSGSFGMSPDGRTVTGLYWRPGYSDGSAHGFYWTAGTGMVGMGSDGRSSRIDGSSLDGTVLVGWDEHPQYGNRRATVWVNGVKTVLDNTDWPSEAHAVNAAGTIIVGQAGDTQTLQVVAAVWKWNGGAWDRTLLGVVPARVTKNATSYAEAVSDDGSVVVGSNRPDWSSPKQGGFIWTAAGGMVDATDYLKSNGASLKLAKVINFSAISPDGQFIGATTQDQLAPHTTRGLMIRRQPTP
jgi:uncharacterized membrane protein